MTEFRCSKCGAFYDEMDNDVQVMYNSGVKVICYLCAAHFREQFFCHRRRLTSSTEQEDDKMKELQ